MFCATLLQAAANKLEKEIFRLKTEISSHKKDYSRSGTVDAASLQYILIIGTGKWI